MFRSKIVKNIKTVTISFVCRISISFVFLCWQTLTKWSVSCLKQNLFQVINLCQVVLNEVRLFMLRDFPTIVEQYIKLVGVYLKVWNGFTCQGLNFKVTRDILINVVSLHFTLSCGCGFTKTNNLVIFLPTTSIPSIKKSINYCLY